LRSLVDQLGGMQQVPAFSRMPAKPVGAKPTSRNGPGKPGYSARSQASARRGKPVAPAAVQPKNFSVMKSCAQIQQEQISGTKQPKFPAPIHVNLKAPREDIWNDIAQLNRAEADAAEEAEVVKEANKRAKYQASLRKQLTEQEQQRVREKKVDDRYVAEKNQELEKWKVDEAAKEKQQRQRNMDQKAAQDRQRTERLRQKQAEDKNKADDDQRLIELLEVQAQDEEMRERKRKVGEQQRQEKVMRENDRELANKAVAMKQAQAADVKMAEDYARMETEKEEKRKQALDDMSEKIRKKMEAGAVLSKEADRRAADNDRRAQRDAAKYLEQQRNLENRNLSKAQKRTADQKRVLAQQIADKKNLAAAEAVATQKQVQRWKQEADNAKRQEQQKVKETRLKAKEHQHSLEAQMKQRVDRAQLSDQTDQELLLNRELLRKVQQRRGDPGAQALPSIRR
jgi:hypothetical protein